MKTEHGWMMIALAATLALAMTFPLQRAARADDTGKIIAAVVAGVILAEALDNDHSPAYRHPPYGKAWGQYGKRAGYQPYRGYGGWRPAPVIYGPPGPYYEPQRSGTRINVRVGPNGKTSVGFQYRDYRSR
jgi:hypothetical protein